MKQNKTKNKEEEEKDDKIIQLYDYIRKDNDKNEQLTRHNVDKLTAARKGNESHKHFATGTCTGTCTSTCTVPGYCIRYVLPYRYRRGALPVGLSLLRSITSTPS